jgi:hypothetical protein
MNPSPARTPFIVIGAVTVDVVMGPIWSTAGSGNRWSAAGSALAVPVATPHFRYAHPGSPADSSGNMVRIRWARGERWHCAINCSIRTPQLRQVFDTIGAGDPFNAGYLQAHPRSDDITESLRAGCVTATATISHCPRQYIRPPELSL